MATEEAQSAPSRPAEENQPADEAELHELILLQAEDLAASLRTTQQDLVRREQDLNARGADLENKLRAARLWFREREAAQAKREREALERLAVQNARHVPPANDAATKTRLTELESLLADGLRQLDEERKQFRTEAEQQRADLAEERRRQSARIDEAERELAERERALAARTQRIEQRALEVNELFGEVSEVYQRALHLCEVYARLADHRSPVAEAEIAAVFDEISGERAALDQQQRELAASVAELGELESRLTQRQAELTEWFTRRQAAMEEEAARLIARGHELDRQQRQQAAERDDWQAEKRRLEAELRRLKTQQAHGAVFAA